MGQGSKHFENEFATHAYSVFGEARYTAVQINLGIGRVKFKNNIETSELRELSKEEN